MQKLVAHNIQIDGVVELKGHTSDSQNEYSLKAFYKIQPEVYNKYRETCHNPESPVELIEITPKRIAMFKRGYPGSKTDVVNTQKKMAVE